MLEAGVVSRGVLAERSGPPLLFEAQKTTFQIEISNKKMHTERLTFLQRWHSSTSGHNRSEDVALHSDTQGQGHDIEQ
jgi:hypothetical protein